MSKRLYDILGVNEESSKEEIKKAFRKIAMKCHPDRNPGPEGEEKFKEASKAYEILENDELREKYNLFGDAALNDDGTLDGLKDLYEGMSDSMSDMFRQSMGGFNNFKGKFKNASNKLFRKKDVSVKVSVSLDQLLNGADLKISYTHYIFDTGLDDFVSYKGNKTIKLPANLSNGTNLRIKGAGNLLKDQTERGYLVVKIVCEGNENVTLDGSDIMTNDTVSLMEALLNKEKTLTIAGQTWKYQVNDADLDKGEKILKGQGLGQKSQGDLIIKLNLVLPKNLSDEAKTKLTELETLL